LIVNNIQTNIKPNTPKVNFKGIKQVLSNEGYKQFEICLPYDTDRFKKVSVEIVPVVKQKNKIIPDKNAVVRTLDLKDGKLDFDPSLYFGEDQVFGYRLVLTDNDGQKLYHTDSGLRTNQVNSEAKYTVMFPNRTYNHNSGGIVITTMPSLNTGYEMKDGRPVKVDGMAEKAENVRANHFSSIAYLPGSSIASMMNKIPKWSEMGARTLLINPLTGEGPHGYWTGNSYQVSPIHGTNNDVRAFVVELYKYGMSLDFDFADTSQGLNGYLTKHVDKYGEKSPYFYVFQNTSEHITKALLPNVDHNSPEGKEILSHIKMHVVNGNYKYTCEQDGIKIEKNTRDTSKPTYVQLYDDRFLSESQKKQISEGKIISPSDKLEPDNHYDVTRYNHSVHSEPREIAEDEIAGLHSRIEKVKDDYSSNKMHFLQYALDFENVGYDKTTEGATTWDGYIHLLLNRHATSQADETVLPTITDKKKAQYAAILNQHDTAQAPAHFVRTVRDSLNNYALQQVKNAKEPTVEGYRNMLNSPDIKLPPRAKEIMTDEILANIINGNYHIPQLETSNHTRERIVEELMNYPLPALKFADDVVAVLKSPWISYIAPTVQDIGKTRYEFYRDNGHKRMPDSDIDFPNKYKDMYEDVDSFYTIALTEFALDVLSKADKEAKLGLFDKEQNLSEKGKLALPLVMHDILEFAMVKSLAPNVKITNKEGELFFDEKALKETNLKNLGGKGISAKSPEEEARKTFNLMKDGLAAIPDPDKKVLINSIEDKLSGVRVEDLKVTLVMNDRLGLGANVRVDAAKDFMRKAACLAGLENLGPSFDKAIELLANVVQTSQRVDRNTRVRPELTDLGEKDYFGKEASGRFENGMGAEIIAIYEAGLLSPLNYNFGFSQSTEFAQGQGDMQDYKKGLLGMNPGWKGNEGFYFNFPSGAINESYNFVDNHDKTRVLTAFILDNDLYSGKKGEEGQRNKLNAAIQKYTPDVASTGLTPSYHSIAMADALSKPLEASVDKLGINSDQKSAVKKSLSLALQDLAQGKFKGKQFNADAFGESSVDIALNDVIIQAKEHGLKLDKDDESKLFKGTLNIIMPPAFEKLISAMKFLLFSIPGKVVVNEGTQYGATGSETYKSNVNVGNRSVAIDRTKDMPEYQKLHDDLEKLFQLKVNPNLETMNVGESVVLTTDDDTMATLMYDKDNEIILLNGKNKNAVTSEIDLSPRLKEDTIVAGLAGGLAVGTYFVNAIKEDDKAAYGVCKEAGNYIIKKFQDFKDFETYLTHRKFGKKYDLVDSHKISISDNLMILKKTGKAVARQAFGGNQNQNHIKIQAYLNSKQSLNIPQRNAI